jgi:hypothetical protein
MLLCEEYASRHKIKILPILYVQKGFLFFDEDKKLLVIKWMKQGPHPGFYEISECKLDNKIKTIKNSYVNWDEYEKYLTNWIRSRDQIVSSSSEVFDLVWQYFLRKNDKTLAENYDSFEIFETVNEKNSKRILNAVCFLEKLSKKHPSIADFWSSKANDIISKYSYWLLDFKKSLV